MTDVDSPMGNAELRLSLAGIESEIGDIKSIAMETRDQAKKTNGRVNVQERLIWLAMGAIPLLSIWAWVITQSLLDSQKALTPLQQAAIQESVHEGLIKAATEYTK